MPGGGRCGQLSVPGSVEPAGLGLPVVGGAVAPGLRSSCGASAVGALRLRRAPPRCAAAWLTSR